jgi:hypothetical protein
MVPVACSAYLNECYTELLVPLHPRTTNVPKPTLDTTMCDFAGIEITTWAFHVWNFGQGHISRSSRMVQMYRTYIYVLLDEGNKTLQQQHHNKTMSRNGLIEWIMKCYHFAIVETLNLAAHVYNRVCKLSMEGTMLLPNIDQYPAATLLFWNQYSSQFCSPSARSVSTPNKILCLVTTLYLFVAVFFASYLALLV